MAMAAALACAVAAHAQAQEARVIDGDTLAMAGQRHRLHGVDAPELGQTCRTVEGTPWPCGEAAKRALENRIGGRAVTCRAQGRDRYHRHISVCFADDNPQSLNAWLAENGWVLACRKYSEDYVDEERRARIARRGLWNGTFVEPWVWRKYGKK